MILASLSLYCISRKRDVAGNTGPQKVTMTESGKKRERTRRRRSFHLREKKKNSAGKGSLISMKLARSKYF